MSASLSLPVLRSLPSEPYFNLVPEVVSIEITSRCNLYCRHCFNESGLSTFSELPLERIEAVLDEVKAWGIRSVRITGGEPTVYAQFRDVVDACGRRDIGIELNSNGIYSSETLKYLKSAPIDIFLVSVDGLETNNDAVRGRGTFRRVVDTCEQLKTSGRRVMLSFHVSTGNRDDVQGLTELAAELGIDFKAAPLRPIGRATRELPNCLLDREDLYGVVRQLTGLRRDHPEIHIYTDFDLIDGSSLCACTRDPHRASCAAGRTMVNIRPDGAINPCAFFDDLGDEFCAGNIFQETVTEVWQRPSTFYAFRVQRKAEECQDCDFYQIRCNGGCPALAYAVTGYLDAFDPLCFAALIKPEEFAELEDTVPPLPFARFVVPPEGGES